MSYYQKALAIGHARHRSLSTSITLDINHGSFLYDHCRREGIPRWIEEYAPRALAPTTQSNRETNVIQIAKDQCGHFRKISDALDIYVAVELQGLLRVCLPACIAGK
jgi:hypothetical protein